MNNLKIEDTYPIGHLLDNADLVVNIQDLKNGGQYLLCRMVQKNLIIHFKNGLINLSLLKEMNFGYWISLLDNKDTPLFHGHT